MIRWCVSRPAVAASASLALLVAGTMASVRLPLATRTTVELRQLHVGSRWVGAAPELMEMHVTAPIEAVVQGIRGVRSTSSESREGTSSITITLAPDADLQLARLAVLERIEVLRRSFPPGAETPEVGDVVPEDLQEAPLLRVLLTGPYTRGALQRVASTAIVPRINALPGVAGTSVLGGTRLGVSVSFDAATLRRLGIAPDALTDAVRQARLVAALGEQRLGSSVRRVVLRDQPESVEALRALPVLGPGGRVIRLGDVATIRPEEDARNAFFRIDGFPALAFAVRREAGADAVQTATRVRAALAELAATLPAGMRTEVDADGSREIAEELRDLLRRGGIAAAAVVVVLALTLRNVRGVLLVMGSAALSVAGTALALFLLGIPSNSLTLAGLGMGIGMLVQNAVVVVERLRRVPDDAASRADAGRRILPAVLGSTLTTCVVLLPFLYLQGNARAAFVPFAAAFLLGLGWSVVAAVLVVPALAEGHGMRDHAWPKGRRLYGRVLTRLLRARWLVLGVLIVGLGTLGWGFVTKVPRSALGTYGPEERTTVSAFLRFPRGSDPATLDAAMQELEQVVIGRPGVEDVTAFSVDGARAQLTATIAREAAFTTVPEQVEGLLIERSLLLGGAGVSVVGRGPGFFSGGAGGQVASRLKVTGYSYAGVERLALDLKARLTRIPRVVSVNANAGALWGDARAWYVSLDPDRAALRRFGLSTRDFAAAVAREVRGAVAEQRLEIGGEELPVSVKAAGVRERSLEALRDAIVPTASRAPARIGDLAIVGEREGLGGISRENQRYVRIVSYEMRGTQERVRQTNDAFLASITVPPGYAVGLAPLGYEDDDASRRRLWLVFGVGVVLVVLVVAMVFDSAWAAAMVLLSLPVPLGGVAAAFWATGTAFTREAAVGVILVVGLAVHQSILLLDGIMRGRRSSPEDDSRPGRALTAAVLWRVAMERSAMIMLVTLTTLASLIPMAVGTDTTTLFGAIALAMTGGTIFGTLGAMLALPVLVLPLARTRRAAPSLTPPAADAPAPAGPAEAASAAPRAR